MNLSALNLSGETVFGRSMNEMICKEYNDFGGKRRMRLIDANALKSVEKEIVCGKTRTPYAKDHTAILRVYEVDEIRNAPTIDAIPVVRCRDCRYFEYDHFEKVNDFPVPLIVAHEICTRWSDGCKTSEDGFCFMGERRADDS